MKIEAMGFFVQPGTEKAARQHGKATILVADDHELLGQGMRGIDPDEVGV